MWNRVREAGLLLELGKTHDEPNPDSSRLPYETREIIHC
jgi:hypothetical protein